MTDTDDTHSIAETYREHERAIDRLAERDDEVGVAMEVLRDLATGSEADA